MLPTTLKNFLKFVAVLHFEILVSISQSIWRHIPHTQKKIFLNLKYQLRQSTVRIFYILALEIHLYSSLTFTEANRKG